MSTTIFKASQAENGNVIATIFFEKPTPVVWDQPIEEVKKVFEGRRNREHREENIMRFEAVRATLDYAESLGATLLKMYNDGEKMSNLNLVLSFGDQKKEEEFNDHIYDMIIVALHELSTGVS